MALPTARDRAIDERTRGAWATYVLALEGLEGRKYEEAEAQAWEALQRDLELVGVQSAYGDRRTRV